MISKSFTRVVRTSLAVAAFTLATMSASAQLVDRSAPYSGSTVNPCNGETVNFSGTIRYNEKTQVSTDGRIHFIANNSFSASGNGQSTGARYNLSGNMQTNSKFPSFPITFRQRTRFISTSSYVPSFHSTFAFHVNGGGVQTQVTTTSDCRG